MEPELNPVAQPETDVDIEALEVKPRRSRLLTGCKWTIFILGLILLGLVIWIGPIIRDFVKAGFLTKVEERTYSGTTITNLKDMHQAMLLYCESEDRFPYAEGWMNEVEPRLQAGDMSASESVKKMISPAVSGQAGAFGYAMNDIASAKHPDDIAEPEITPLIFDSSDLTKNAHGSPEKLLPNPARDGQNHGVSVAGNLLKL